MSGNRPRCPKCEGDMTLRTANRGPRPGKRFWGCLKFPDCRGTATFNDAEENPVISSVTNSPNAPQPEIFTNHPNPARVFGLDVLRKQRVNWFDGTFDFEDAGWQVNYTTVGASLRSVKVEGIDSFSNCWVASTPISEFEPDSNTRRVLDVMGKLLRRGLTPPLHPDSERVLIESVGLGDRIRPSSQPGDVSFNLHGSNTVGFHDLDVIPGGYHVEIEPSLAESDEERLLMEWMAKHHPRAVRWLIPQASFDGLLQAAGHRAGGYRRCDFLWAPPGSRPFVIEIDGAQHETQQLTDQERDQLLREIDIETIRVSTSGIRMGHGPQLEAVANAIEATAGQTVTPSDKDKLLVWVPIQVHRLVLGLCEAIHRGFLSGDSWVVEVEDPTHMTIELMAPYLEMLYALCCLWDARSVAPERVLFEDKDDEEKVLFRRTPEGRYERRDASEQSGSITRACILLQCNLTSCQPLPDHDGTPTVVVRSSGVPVLMSDPPEGDSNRVAVRIEGDEGKDPLKILLRSVFAKENFREGQYEALVEVMNERDCAVLLPTGAGKSLIYQLAGLCLPGRTLVIDPLVALIEDQIEGLHLHGIDRATGITGNLGRTDREIALRAVAESDDYFLFVAPERLQTQKFRDAIREAPANINLVVIDEAHCVSEWGHDFRPAYLNLGRVLREVCQNMRGIIPPLIALTGTASKAVLNDVLFQLDIPQDSTIQPETFDRSELHYKVICTSNRHPANLLRVLRNLPELFNERRASFFQPRGEQTFSGLIFVPTVRGNPSLEHTTRAVQKIIPSASMYSSRKPRNIRNEEEWNRIRQDNSRQFKDNSIVALVSTKAFGMGIDKPNIRWVIHYMLPSSVESYYQEVGRAGRNNSTSQCVILLREFDTERNQRMLSENQPLESLFNNTQNIRNNERDNVTTALYFHLNNFPGIDAEVSTLTGIANLLSPEALLRQVTISFNDNENARERALHRLTYLGVVRDYLKEYGSRVFNVTVNAVQANNIVSNYIKFVMRIQPGLNIDIITDRVGNPDTLMNAIEVCGRELIELVYRTIEQSRRRSLREMWLAAHDAARSQDPDNEMRQRVLDYMTQGFASHIFQRLIKESHFRFSDWLSEWDAMESEEDAHQWRGAAARLLGSYPDHPGLLATRALSEVLISNGDPYELESNLISSLKSADSRYQTNTDDVQEAIYRILRMVIEQKPQWCAGVVGPAFYHSELSKRTMEEAMLSDTDNWPLAVFSLAEGVESARDLAISTLETYGGD